jgi:hypothetical protein
MELCKSSLAESREPKSLLVELSLLLPSLSGKTLVVYEYHNSDVQIVAYREPRTSLAKRVCDDVMQCFDEPPIFLSGNSATINAQIERFRVGPSKYLLIDAAFFFAGLNLQFVHNLVILNRLNNFEQVCGRVDRIGRDHDVQIITFKRVQ